MENKITEQHELAEYLKSKYKRVSADSRKFVIDPDYMTARSFAELEGWPKYSTLRTLIRERSQNGFDSVVKKAGGLYFINLKQFKIWMQQRDNKA